MTMSPKNATAIQEAVASYKESSVTVPPPRGGEWIENPEFEKTGNMLGRAFAGTDKVPCEPIFDWTFNHLNDDGSNWFTNEDKIEVCTFILKSDLLKLMKQDRVLILLKQIDDEVVSAAVVAEIDSLSNKSQSFGSRIFEAWIRFQVFLTMITQLPKSWVNREHKKEISHYEKKGKVLQKRLLNGMKKSVQRNYTGM